MLIELLTIVSHSSPQMYSTFLSLLYAQRKSLKRSDKHDNKPLYK